MDTKMFPVWTRGAFKVHQAPATLFNEVRRFFGERGLLIQRSHEQAFATSEKRRLLVRKGPTANSLESEGSGLENILCLYKGAMKEAEESKASTSKIPNINSVHNSSTMPDTTEKSAELDKLVRWLVGIQSP